MVGVVVVLYQNIAIVRLLPRQREAQSSNEQGNDICGLVNRQLVGVLPIDNIGGAEGTVGRTFRLTFSLVAQPCAPR